MIVVICFLSSKVFFSKRLVYVDSNCIVVFEEY